ncbi:uncharacterized protein ACWYII_030932 isoform 2-T2 [Salvelinus alpinus]
MSPCSASMSLKKWDTLAGSSKSTAQNPCASHLCGALCQLLIIKNGFQVNHMKMLITNRTIFLTITEVDVADSGLYFCGTLDNFFIFTNATVLKVQGHIDYDKDPTEHYDKGEEDGTMKLFLLVVILGVVTAVLLIIILILVLKVRRDANRLNTGPDSKRQPQNDQNQDTDALNYATLNFTSKKKKRERRREKELDPHVVYAATR